MQRTPASIASPQSAVLQASSDIESRPVQRILSSVDDGSLLQSEPEPPAKTLTLYPVYKLSNIEVNSGIARPRPLSYRWLLGLCADHIHCKPDVVERYVERLELLHIVPRNPTDSRDRSLRSALTRRCFRQPTDDCGGSPGGDTPKGPRRRRGNKSLPTLPPKKLL